MGLLDLPSNWVYIEYANGERQNIANTDTLYPDEAEKFKEYWEKTGKKVVKMTLETSDGKCLKSYDFKEEELQLRIDFSVREQTSNRRNT